MLNIPLIYNGKWEVLDTVKVSIGDDVIFVEKGFVTDLISSPILFWFLIPPHKYIVNEAVLHDYLCRNKIFELKKCNDIFFRLIKVKLSIFKYYLVVAYVRAFSWIRYYNF